MAGDGDPHYQLGAFLNEAFQFEDDMRVALEIAEGTVQPASFYRARAYAVVDDLYWAFARLCSTAYRRAPASNFANMPVALPALPDAHEPAGFRGNSAQARMRAA